MDITLFESATAPPEMRESFFPKMRSDALQRADITVNPFEKGELCRMFLILHRLKALFLSNPTMTQRSESVLRYTEKMLSCLILPVSFNTTSTTVLPNSFAVPVG